MAVGNKLSRVQTKRRKRIYRKVEKPGGWEKWIKHKANKST